jgi:amino acid transporter
MSTQLRTDALNFWEVLAQSVAMIGPSITPVLIVPLMFAQAGNAGWLAYVFAAIMLGAVALNINVFAGRSASAGSLYAFSLRAFGPRGALFIGWCQLWAYVFVGVASACAFAVFVPSLAAALHLPLSNLAATLLCVALAWLLSYRDVRISAVALLGFEGAAITLIAIITVLIFVHHHGSWIDLDQIRLVGVTPTAIALGTVLAVFSLLGFESATSLGEEARAPLKTIPRAVMASVLLSSLFFVIVTYAEILGTRGFTPSLDKMTTPLDTIADALGASFMKVPIDIGAVLCCLSIVTAAVNGAARALLMMGRTGLMPAAFGITHPTHETPARALTTVALIVAAISGGAIAAGRAPVDAFGDCATLCSYAFVLVYGAVAIGASVYLRRLGELRRRNVVISALAVAFLFVPAIGSVYPVPPWPANLYPIGFVVYAAIGVVLLWRRPQSALALLPTEPETRRAVPTPSS